MRLVTLKEIAALEPGEIVPGFRAQIKEVKQPKSGQNEHGPWTIQSLTLMDSTAIVQVKLFDAPAFTPQWVNAWIVVESSMNDKGKLSGILVSTYRDKKEIHVKAKSGAVITQATDAPSNQPAATEPDRMPPPQTQPKPTQQAPPVQQAPPPVQTVAPEKQPAPKHNGPSSDDVRQSIVSAKRRLGQAANGMILCYDATLYVVNEVSKAHPELTAAYFSPDIISKIAISFSIQLDRGLLITGLPTGPLDAWTKKAQSGKPTEGGGVG